MTRRYPSTPLPWRTALVTGASSGIGEAVARELVARDVAVVLVARRRDRLERLADELRTLPQVAASGVDVEVLVADLTDAAERSAVERRLRDDTCPVDLLVNNAGAGTSGSFRSLPLEGECREVELNVVAPLRLMHAALGPMVGRGHGAVMNISSLATYQPAPTSATYAATKAFLTSLSESVYEELRGTGVHVTAVLPGYTRTEFGDNTDGSTFEKVPAFAWMTAESVAHAAVEATVRRRALCVPGAGYKAVTAAVTPLPRSTRRWLVGKVSRLS